jgi:hypothetical protein
MKQPMWDSKSAKAYETGQGVELVNEPYPHYVPSQKKREWVGLTEEEIKECFAITPDQFLPWQIYKRIEAKLKEKNT